MGGQLSTDTLCNQEWDSYLKTSITGKNEDGWELVLDDSRSVDINGDMTIFW